ncbi:MAG: DUF896 domain-containing protein [Ignavibacteriales bacterium]
MITNELIDRLNQLALKKKAEGLSPEEQEEQKALYKDYLSAIRGQVTSQLENAGLQKKGEPHACHDGCCGHDHHHHGPNCGCNHDKH